MTMAENEKATTLTKGTRPIEIPGPNDSLIKMWTQGVPVEEGAIIQLQKVASLPFIFKWVAVMPDVHIGIGATVGSVIATKGAVIPAAVGVDIGCGMTAVKTNLTRDHLKKNRISKLRERVEKAIPHGRTNNGGKGDRGAWGSTPDDVKEAWEVTLEEGYQEILSKDPKIATGREISQLSTLGGGNHFIEVLSDKEGYLWVILHSGSRGIGNRIGTYFINAARQEMDRGGVSLPDRDLAYLTEEEGDGTLFQRYKKAAIWAQKYAKENRRLMIERVLASFEDAYLERVEEIDCHHNYLSQETHFNEEVYITRKGAIRARVGDLGIIPGAMGRSSFIVTGKGNPDSFTSCSHGAGRVMSRSAAKKKFTLEKHIEATKGVDCKKDLSVIDETPMAYKDIEAVMKAQEELVEVKYHLQPIIVIKG
jgi:tRNA-splicing ligase RtcB